MTRWASFATTGRVPLPAIRELLREHQEFEVDLERSSRFLITHHPSGWLRRLPYNWAGGVGSC